MTSGPLLVYEIPDSGGRGHRLLVPAGGGVTADQAARLIASIRGPVHVAADRLGVVRAMKQGSRGANRDSSAIAIIAGIDVYAASPGSVVAALTALEKSLDDAIAEAAGLTSPAYATSMPSQVAASVLDSIAIIGFCSCPLASAGVRETVSTDPQPRTIIHMGAPTLLAGTLAALACGVAIGWVVQPRVHENPHARPTPGFVELASSVVPESRHHDVIAPSFDGGDEERLPAGDSGAGLMAGASSSVPSPVAPVPSAAPSVRDPATVVEDGPTQRPNPRIPPDTVVVFHVECRGTAAGDRIQLIRSTNKRPIGVSREAQSTSVSFDVDAAEDLMTPEEVMVSFSEPPPFPSWEGINKIERLSCQAGADQYSCVFDFETRRRGGIVNRRVDVSVTMRRSVVGQTPVPSASPQ